jgi:4-carboxymuconolactone decarboxylase
VVKYQEIEKDLTLSKRAQALCSISALVSLGNHDFLQSYIRYALSETLEIEDIQEAILQCYLFAGFPAAIEGFIVLKTVQEDNFKPLENKAEDNISLWRERGAELCKKIYASNYDKMVKNVNDLNPDLADWMLVEGYGKTLSRSGLSPINRELCAVASLAVLGWKRQLFSHSKGAINLGATKADVESVYHLVELYKADVVKKSQYILDLL